MTLIQKEEGQGSLAIEKNKKKITIALSLHLGKRKNPRSQPSPAQGKVTLG